MNKLRVVLSLTTHDNDYQIEQATAAEESAKSLGVELEVLYAENDAIQQSQQLLNIIQSRSGSHPDAIMFEPAGGTAFPQVARAAVAMGIGWVVLNREADYLSDLRRTYRVPLFSVTSNHEEIGRIQGKQISTLLPNGGTALLIQGPAESFAAKQRTAGMYDTKPIDVQLKIMKANWTEAGAYKAVSSWLRLSTSKEAPIDVVAAQNDAMALGARKAFQDIPDPAIRNKFLQLPYLGIDGVRNTGQAWLSRGLLHATIVVPPCADTAIQMLHQSLQTGSVPPEKTLTVPKSLPAIDELARKPVQKSLAAGAS